MLTTFYLLGCIFTFFVSASSKTPVNEKAWSACLDRSPSYKGINEFLKAHQTDHDFLIVTVANKAHSELLFNWIESMRQNMENTNKFVVVCLDKTLYKVLQQQNIPAIGVNVLINNHNVSQIYSGNTFES